MKKTIAAALMAAFLFMGQTCGTGVQISGPAVIAAVQGLCGIVVPIADIAALVNANPALASVDVVANAICNAFQAQMTKHSQVAASNPVPSPVSGTLIVDGVLVHWTAK